MGLIYKGMPIDLVQNISATHKPEIFVETGTYFGDSVAEAEPMFPLCYSIEIVDELYAQAQERFKDQHNIKLLHGNSAAKIAEIDFSDCKSAFFWLDAHYSGGVTGGEGECPLIKEIEYISALPIDTYIFIDDARFILSPYQGERYCTLEKLFSILPKKNYNVVINDIVMSTPPSAKN